MDNLQINDLVQSVISEQIAKDAAQKQEEVIDEFNQLQLYYGEDYVVNDRITIKQPEINDFIKYGDKKILATIAPFTTNTTASRAQLWDKGIDWNKISNFELFSMLIKDMDFECSQIFFGDIDFSSFSLYEKELNGNTEVILYSEKMEMEITEQDYEKMSKYLCNMFGIELEEEFTRLKKLKQELVNNDKINQAQKAKETDGFNMRAMISFAVNHPGFKHTKEEIRHMKIVEFMDSIQRLQIYEATHALMGGMYSGMVDVKKIPKSEFNFMR